MEEKKGLGQVLSDFFAGKGFYIVLLLCAALIATSIWLMADGSRADVETNGGETEYRITEDGPDHAGDLPVMSVSGVPGVKNTPAPPAQQMPERRENAALPSPEAPAAVQEPPEQAVETVSLPATDYFIWPVNGRLLRSYSADALSYDPTMGDWRLHSGWDIAAPAGDKVLSAANGVVSAVYTDPALGTVVEVSHTGDLVSVYANLDADCPVSVGQTVSVGSVLGTVGDTALWESGENSHLHFAMRRGGEPADPGVWLPDPAN